MTDTTTQQYLYQDDGYSDIIEADSMDEAVADMKAMLEMEPNTKYQFTVHSPDCEKTETYEDPDVSGAVCDGSHCESVTVTGPAPEEPECYGGWRPHEWIEGSVRGGQGLDIVWEYRCSICGLTRVEANIQTPGQGDQMNRLDVIEYVTQD